MAIAHDEVDRNAREPTIVAQWELNRRESVRIELHQFKGHPLIGIRKWFAAEDGTLRPGKDGINLNVKHLPKLAAAISEALSLADLNEEGGTE